MGSEEGCPKENEDTCWIRLLDRRSTTMDRVKPLMIATLCLQGVAILMFLTVTDVGIVMGAFFTLASLVTGIIGMALARSWAWIGFTALTFIGGPFLGFIHPLVILLTFDPNKCELCENRAERLVTLIHDKSGRRRRICLKCASKFKQINDDLYIIG